MTRQHQQSVEKERGCWLTGWLVLMAIDGIVASLLVFYLRRQPGSDSPLWLAVLAGLSIATVVAAIAIWYWKRWGLVLYAITVVISIAVGLVLTRSQLWVFHEIIPLAILGYLIRDKWAYFGMGSN